MKKLILLSLLSVTGICGLHAQVKEKAADFKTDEAAQKIIRFLRDQQPVSVYAFTGTSFRQKITAENFNSISRNQILPLNNFKITSFISSMNGINKHKIEGEPTLQLMVGLDAEGKVETLLIQPYVQD